MDIANLYSKLFIPIKAVSNKDKLLPKFVYLRDTHGKIKIYKSIKSLTKNLTKNDYDLILRYEVTAIKGRDYDYYSNFN